MTKSADNCEINTAFLQWRYYPACPFLHEWCGSVSVYLSSFHSCLFSWI